MLGKLLKYDLKWIYKVVVVFYVLALIFSVIGRGLGEIENSLVFSITSKIAIGIAISMLVNILINCFIRLWARFVKNIYKDEAYLTHTLPVTKKKIYDSKIISTLVCIFTTTIVILACLFICYYSESTIQALKSALELAASTYDTTVLKLLLLMSFVIFLEILFFVFIGYVGIILGHKSNRNKMLRSIVISFAIYFGLQIVTILSIFIIALFNPEIMNLFNTTDAISIDAIKIAMYVGIGVYIIYLSFLYIIGKRQLEKGVNVE